MPETRQRLTKKEKLRLRVLAREIAFDLFTYGASYGASVCADRLVQVAGYPERPLGGWGIGPATDRIFKHLVDHAEDQP